VTLLTTLAAPPTVKLISLVQGGPYGWNGASSIREIEVGHQPVVSLNPNGGYETLRAATWPVASGGLHLFFNLVWPAADTGTGRLTTYVLPFRFYQDLYSETHVHEKGNLLWEGTISGRVGYYDEAALVPLGEGEYVYEIDLPGWADTFYDQGGWTYHNDIVIDEWDAFWGDDGPIAGEYEQYLAYYLPVGTIALAQHAWPWNDVYWPKNVPASATGSVHGLVRDRVNVSWSSGGVSVTNLPPGDTYDLRLELPSYGSFWGTHHDADWHSSRVIPYPTTENNGDCTLSVNEWYPNTFDVDLHLSDAPENNPTGTYTLYYVHSTDADELGSWAAAAVGTGHWEVLATHDYNGGSYPNGHVTSGGVIPPEYIAWVFQFPGSFASPYELVHFGILTPNGKSAKQYFGPGYPNGHAVMAGGVWWS
jgi:hypothetical protein